MNKFILFFLLITLYTLVECEAKETLLEAKILAVVDDSLISNLDLDRRITLIEGISGKKTNNIDRNNVLQYLIDEHLFFKLAANLNIVVSNEEVETAIKDMGVNINNVNHEDLLRHIRSKLLWSKIFSQHVVPTINVADAEINSSIAEVKRKKDMVNIVKLIKKDNNNWEEMPIGWVEIDALDPEINKAVLGIKVDGFSQAIHKDGVDIKFKIIDLDNSNVLNSIFTIKKLGIGVIDYKEEYCANDFIEAKGLDFGSNTRIALVTTADKNISAIIKEGGAKYRIALCKSNFRNNIAHSIFLTKIEKEQRKYLAKLRENTFIDVRS